METINVMGSIIFTIIVGGLLCALYEKLQWNNGVCRECGEEWICFDVDSQGGRGYRCKNFHFCWISYPVDSIKK